MTGHSVHAADLRPGQRFHIEPHQVHDRPAGYVMTRTAVDDRETDAEIDAIRQFGHEVMIDCHPCFLGASGQLWTTTYHDTDMVLVIGSGPWGAA